MSSKRSQDHLGEPRYFMTEEELAARWRHSLRSLQRWRADGNGPKHTRIGRRVVFRVADIEAFEAKHMRAEGHS